MEKTTIEKYSDTEVKEIKTVETIVPITDYQTQIDAKQREIDTTAQTLADEVTRTTARQDEIKTLIASLNADLAAINAKIIQASQVGVVEATIVT